MLSVTLTFTDKSELTVLLPRTTTFGELIDMFAKDIEFITTKAS